MELNIDYDKLLSENGQYKTQGMFYEFRSQSRSEYAPFTMADRHKNGLISVYKIYIESDSEYEAASKLLNSWKHWQILSETVWFKKELEIWREEKSMMEATVGLKTLIEQAKDGNVAAARYLVDKNTSKKVGRPTRTQIIEEKKKQARVDSKVSSIIDRMSKYQK